MLSTKTKFAKYFDEGIQNKNRKWSYFEIHCRPTITDYTAVQAVVFGDQPNQWGIAIFAPWISETPELILMFINYKLETHAVAYTFKASG